MAKINRVADKATKVEPKNPVAKLGWTVEKDGDDLQLDELFGKVDGETILIHNQTKGEFHVPPVSFKPGDIDMADIVIFQVGEIRPFSKAELDNKQFKKCLYDKKLRVVTVEEAKKIEAEQSRQRKKKGGEAVAKGLHDSGLPMNTRVALNYIWDCDDIEELEAFNDLDDRELINNAIEERIEELEATVSKG